MTIPTEDIYKSENGDCWRLIQDTPSGRVLVRHEANLSSGGHVTDMDVEEFLSRGGSGPEHVALQSLLKKSANACFRDESFYQDSIEAVSGVAEGETLVGCFPQGDYRLEAGPEGVKLIRRSGVGTASTVDAGPVTPTSISIRNRSRRLWNRRHDDP